MEISEACDMPEPERHVLVCVRGWFCAHAAVMQRAALLALLMLAGACATRPLQPRDEDVLGELSRRTALPVTELRERLAQCPSDLPSGVYCAHRDVVTAELTLQLIAADKVRELPGCRMPVERTLERFEHTRDARCKLDPLQPSAAALDCAAASTRRLTAHIRHITQCGRP
ncbi:MAG: hypothetical protein ABW321_06360 [Polyangiales bacterium]